MQRRLIIGGAPTALVGLALAAAECGGGSNGAATTSGYASAGTGQAATTATVTTRRTKLGTVLVDGRGRTLYLFEKDKGAASTCAGACASVWPPLTEAGKTVAGGGLAGAKLGRFKRADGNAEVTYAGHPLYTYAGDTKPGDVKGQGLDQFGAEWYVLAPSGRKIDGD